VFTVARKEWHWIAHNPSDGVGKFKEGTSQRNVRFRESGRARPSHGMVLKLAEALDVPLRARNEMLLATGYAPFYPQRTFDCPEMTTANHVLQRMLERHSPYPPMVLDGG